MPYMRCMHLSRRARSMPADRWRGMRSRAAHVGQLLLKRAKLQLVHCIAHAWQPRGSRRLPLQAVLEDVHMYCHHVIIQTHPTAHGRVSEKRQLSENF